MDEYNEMNFFFFFFSERRTGVLFSRYSEDYEAQHRVGLGSGYGGDFSFFFFLNS